MKVQIQVYGPLKDYFPSTIQLEVEEGTGSDTLIERLVAQSPAARDLLNRSRIAVDNEIIDHHKPLYGHHEISLLPPSSGG